MKSLVCVDANIVIRTLVPGPFSEHATNLLNRWSQEQVSLIAPSLLAFEVVSTLRRLVYLKELTSDEGDEAFQHFLAFKIRLFHRKAVLSSAWELAQQFDRPRAYDTAYLALAQINQCEFWTADERLYNAVNNKLPWVNWIGEAPLSSND